MQALRDDPATARIARLLDEANERYGSLLTAEEGRTPGRVVVTTSEGNGGQPVLVIVPPGFSADQETAVHTHDHGNNTNVAGEHHATGRTQAILGAVAANPQTILVMPEDAAMDWTDRGDDVLYSARWDNATDQPATTADALRAVDLPADQRPHVSYYRAENDPARSARYERALGDGYDQLVMGEHDHNLTLSQHFGQSLPLPAPAEEEGDSAQERP